MRCDNQAEGNTEVQVGDTSITKRHGYTHQIHQTMTTHSLISIACRLSQTTPRQVTERRNYSCNVNVRALICYLLTKYDRMHPVLIGELIDRPVHDIRAILERINSIDRKTDILSPENIKLFDLIDEAERTLATSKG